MKKILLLFLAALIISPVILADEALNPATSTAQAAITPASQVDVNPAPVFELICDIKPENLQTIINATALPEEGRLVYWEPGKLIGAGAGTPEVWEKYMDFTPEDMQIRKADGKDVGLLNPGKVDNFFIDSRNGLAAFCMHLGDSVNAVLAIEDLKRKKVIYSRTAKTHPPVPGRRFEVVAIEEIDTMPVLSADGKYAAFGIYTYLYSNKIGVLDIKKRKLREIDGAAIPMAWKDSLYYVRFGAEDGKNIITREPFAGGKGEKLAAFDFKVSTVFLFRGVIYLFAYEANKVYGLDTQGDKIIKTVLDINLIRGDSDSILAHKIFPAVQDGKGYLFVVEEFIKGDAREYKMSAARVD